MLHKVEPGGKSKGTALALLTVNPQAAAHNPYQLAADSQPQPRSAKLPRSRAVCLSEGLKHLAFGLLAHADTGITHTDLQLNSAVNHAIQFNSN
ncbi:hypothetical protein D3C76_1598890 [compost metagenome]